MRILDTLVRGDRMFCVRQTDGKEEWTVSVLPADYDLEKGIPAGGKSFTTYAAAKAHQVELASKAVAGEKVPFTSQ